MNDRLTRNNFRTICDLLVQRDSDLKSIVEQYGYPLFWTRPNTFSTLVLIILEQQVSLASAFAAFTKLKDCLKEITPQNFVQLSDEELRGCYFSRQKIRYTQGLAKAVLSKEINLKRFETVPEETVRTELKKLKGIGDWTVDIYLINALQKADVFPIGDLALISAIRMIKGNPAITKEEILSLSADWKPFRSVATMLLWHYYIKKKNIRLLH